MPTFNISFGSAISGLFLRKGTDRIDIPMRLAYAQILNQITTTINWGMIKNTQQSIKEPEEWQQQRNLVSLKLH